MNDWHELIKSDPDALQGKPCVRGTRLSVELSAGKYVLICNVIGHYNSGQFAAFTVQ